MFLHMKEKSSNRQDILHVRISKSEQAAFNEAARVNGLSLSGWTRTVMRKAAVSDLRGAGKDRIAEALTK